MTDNSDKSQNDLNNQGQPLLTNDIKIEEDVKNIKTALKDELKQEKKNDLDNLLEYILKNEQKNAHISDDSIEKLYKILSISPENLIGSDFDSVFPKFIRYLYLLFPDMHYLNVHNSDKLRKAFAILITLEKHKLP